MFTLRPVTIVLPSKEDKHHPVIDLDLHLPFLCFGSRELLQVSIINSDDFVKMNRRFSILKLSFWPTVIANVSVCSSADYKLYSHRTAYGFLLFRLGQTNSDRWVLHVVYSTSALAAPAGAHTVPTDAWLCHGTDPIPHGMPPEPLWGSSHGKSWLKFF